MGETRALFKLTISLEKDLERFFISLTSAAKEDDGGAGYEYINSGEDVLGAVSSKT